MRRAIYRFSFALVTLVASSPLVAQESLPQPLTLEHALSLAESDHPTILKARARQQAALARRDASEADDDFSISLEARARWVLPPESLGDEPIEDHKGAVVVRKSLYDFGRSSGLQQASQSEMEAMFSRYQSERDRHRAAIMGAYFDVLLADRQNARDDEEMAIVYITLDRLRNRQELGQVSDIEILEQESYYQEVRNRVMASEARQRITRSQLANLLNRPGDLPSDLVTPDFNHASRTLPEYERLLEWGLQHNPALQALRLELQAAEMRVESARSEAMPRLDAELEGATYSRELGSSDRWRAGVTLSVPLYNGNRVDAAVAQAQADVVRLQGELALARQELRQALLENWFEVNRLSQKREQAESELAFRELYLDRSRANYEMEYAADLGDAMVRLSEAQLALARTDFDMALGWERLRSLVGTELETLAARGEQMAGEGE